MIGLGRAPCDEGSLQAGAKSPVECVERAKPWVLAATILGSSMAFIDGSVVGVALPAIQADLNASMRDAQWVVNAYMLILGALILMGGAAGEVMYRSIDHLNSLVDHFLTHRINRGIPIAAGAPVGQGGQ